MKNLNLSVFGDNILECERMVILIQEAFPEFNNTRNDYSNKFAPKKILYQNQMKYQFNFFQIINQMIGGDPKSILNILEEYGAKLTEAPDVILTESVNGIETILLAIEFSSAIPAGNQAWQRSGRALSFSEVAIPYLYITDIGLEELDSDRETKAVRTSNPLVPLSYIKHSQRNKSFTYMVLNPSYLLKESEEIKKYIVKDEVSKIINGLILNEDISDSEKSLNEKIANYLNHYKNVPDSIDFFSMDKK